MISKCITLLVNQTEREYGSLNESDKEVVNFHRNGFGIGGNGWVNDIFFEQVATQNNPDHQGYHTLCELSSLTMQTGTGKF